MQAWHVTPAQWRELDDEDRDLMLAHHDLICPDCGNLRSICSDPTRQWYVNRRMCFATAARSLMWRAVREKHKDNEPGTKALHPLDGMDLWASEFDLTPDDKFV